MAPHGRALRRCQGHRIAGRDVDASGLRHQVILRTARWATASSVIVRQAQIMPDLVGKCPGKAIKAVADSTAAVNGTCNQSIAFTAFVAVAVHG